MKQYEIIGEGFPIVLLHGNGEDYHEFDQLMKDLKQYQFICINARYHDTKDHTKHYSYDLLTEDVKKILKTLNINKYGIIGFSDGAIEALKIAMDNDDVAFIISLSANSYPKAIKAHYYYMYLLQYYLYSVFAVYHPVAKRKKKLYALMLKHPHITCEALSKIICPALIMAGEHDVIKEDDTLFIASHISHSVTKIILGGSHFLLNDQYKSTIKEIKNFLNAYFEVYHD